MGEVEAQDEKTFWTALMIGSRKDTPNKIIDALF